MENLTETKLFSKVFITGGAGYVGSLLVPILLEEGYEVTVFDLFLYGDTLPDHPSLTKIKGDIRSRDALIKAVAGHDAVIHLACISNDPSFDLDPKLGKSINLDAFRYVIDSCIENNVQRLIVASSTSQYGIKPLDMDVTEDVEADPITDYAKYKIQCEQMLESADTGDLEYCFVRPATLCGYAPRLRLDLSVNILTIHALVNNKIRIFGGKQMRPALNIKDMIRFYQLVLVAPKEKIHQQAFNVAYENMSIMQIGEMVRDTLASKGHNNISFSIEPSDDQRSYHVNTDKSRNVLGFEYKYSFAEAVLSIKEAYDKGLLKDPMNNPLYYNVKLMKKIDLS